VTASTTVEQVEPRADDSPLVSVVVPSYNHSEYLETALKSLVNQRYDRYEILVIDGGSTDRSVDVIREYDSHLAYWVSEDDSGQSHAINKGFDRANGDIVGWLNADDVLFPDALRQVSSLYLANRNADVFTGNIVYINSDDTVRQCVRVPRMDWRFFRLGVGYFQDPAVFFTAAIVEDVGPLDEELHYSMDQDFWHRLRKAKAHVVHTTDYLGGFRIHDDSKTAEQISGQDEDYSFELPETTAIRQRHIPEVPRQVVRLTRYAYKAWQLLNGNYVWQWHDSREWRGDPWQEVFE